MTKFKKAAITFIIILLLAGIAIVSFAQNMGTVTKEAKLRKTASNDSIVLEIIPKKEEVEILETQGDWYKVEYKKIKGYVQKDFIQVQENSAENNSVQENKQTTNEDLDENLKKGDNAIVKSGVSVYVRPLINSSIITETKKEENVTIMTIMNNWAYIGGNTINGWVTLENITTKKAESEENKKEENLNKKAYISSSGINFRKEPNTNSEVLRVFIQNAQVTVLSEDGQWCKVTYKDQTGYVLKSYISSKKVEVTSRGAINRTAKNNTTSTKKETKQAVKQQTTVSASGNGQQIANYVKKYVGCKYVYGGSTPSGFDCSGLTMYVYKKYGINLPHSATAQSKIGTKVSRDSLQPGDLIFFKNYRTNKGIGHVGIYIGGNKFVHASTERTGVITSTLSGSYASRFVTATRLVK